MNTLQLYENLEIEKKIGELAAEQDGELTDEQCAELARAQMNSLAEIEDMCKWFRKAELFMDVCKAEEERLAALRKRASARIERIQNAVMPYVQAKKKIQAGTFTLSTRKSEAVMVPDGFDDPFFCTKKEVVTPDKKAIKKALEAGDKIEGCSIETRYHLQIK